MTGMNDRIVVRPALPIWVTVQAGLYGTSLLWVKFGYTAGVPTLLVSLILISRALQGGFVLDREGLHMRPLLPFSKPPVIPWARLRAVEVGESRGNTEASNEAWIRVTVDGEPEPPQLLDCRNKSKLKAVLERFRAQGLPATDSRAPS
jgi:hypothetical protein